MPSSAPRLRQNLARAAAALGAAYLAASVLAGCLLPSLLLHPPGPRREDGAIERGLAQLGPPGAHWTVHDLQGGGGVPLRVHWLHRPGARGVAILLHGFGDDALGTAPRLQDLPELDAVAFTFRGRDRFPGMPVTLGGHERRDVAAVVHFLEGAGWPRSRQVLVGASQGAGVALLALADLECEGPPLAGALLESPFKDLQDAAANHLRGTFGGWERLARPAEAIALWRAGRMVGFDPGAVSPVRASRGLRTPVALVAGDADQVTPLPGVQAIAGALGDLTVVPGAGHLEAGSRLPGGWSAWAGLRLRRWGVAQ